MHCSGLINVACIKDYIPRLENITVCISFNDVSRRRAWLDSRASRFVGFLISNNSYLDWPKNSKIKAEKAFCHVFLSGNELLVPNKRKSPLIGSQQMFSLKIVFCHNLL
jgi:hypothetical protein